MSRVACTCTRTTRPLMMMAVRIRLSALLLLLGNACVGDCLRVRIGLVEGYRADWKFMQKFAFAAGTESDPVFISLKAWSFIPEQKVLMYTDDGWFNALQQPTCAGKAAQATTSVSVAKG